MTVACKSCDGPIWWAITTAGKRIPIDDEPVRNGNVYVWGADPDGKPIVEYIRAGDPLPASARYVSHFATCPNAAQHRKSA